MTEALPTSRLWAVRGAVCASANDEASILEATTDLMTELMARNAIGPDDIISVIFTATSDLDAAFPAAAARKLGFDRVPLLCAREIAVPGSMESVVRVLAHYYAGPSDPPEHVYLGDAQALRADLHAAQ